MRKHEFAESVVQAFEENEVEGDELFKLTPRDLREELGIRSLPQRRRLRQVLDTLSANANNRQMRHSLQLQKDALKETESKVIIT